MVSSKPGALVCLRDQSSFMVGGRVRVVLVLGAMLLKEPCGVVLLKEPGVALLTEPG